MRQLTFIEAGRLEWWDVPEPQLQGPLEAIVQPIAVSTCDLDPFTIRGTTPFAATGPFAFGHEFVARVVEVGDAVSAVRPGDTAVVSFQICCGECERCLQGLTASCDTVPPRSMYGFGPLGGDWGGALSDQVRVPFADFMLVPLPDGVEPKAVPSVSDNVCDAYRTVAPHLDTRPGSTVLLLGGSPSCLYAIQIALARGASRVIYADRDAARVATARSLGAEGIEIESWPDRIGSYPVTANGVFDAAGLACALRSTEPGGVCTNAAPIFEPAVPIPLLDMYVTGITFITGRVNARAHMPEVLELVATGRLQPDRVTGAVAGWGEAVDALIDSTEKLVLVSDDM